MAAPDVWMGDEVCKKKFRWLVSSESNMHASEGVLDRYPGLVITPSTIIIRDETVQGDAHFRVFGARVWGRGAVTLQDPLNGIDNLERYIRETYTSKGQPYFIHEVLVAKRPCRAVWEVDGGDAELRASLVSKINMIIREVDPTMTRGCVVYTSDGINYDGKQKFSAHIISMFSCANRRQSVAWANKILDDPRITKTERSVCDVAYMKVRDHQNLRILGSHKIVRKDGVQHVVRQKVAVDPADDNLPESLLGEYEPCNMHLAPFANIVPDEVQTSFVKAASGDGIALPEEQKIIVDNWLAENGLSSFAKFGDNAFIVNRTDTAKICPVCRRTHDREGGYLMILPLTIRFYCWRTKEDKFSIKFVPLWNKINPCTAFWDRSITTEFGDYSDLEKDLRIHENRVAFDEFVQRHIVYIGAEENTYFLTRTYKNGVISFRRVKSLDDRPGVFIVPSHDPESPNFYRIGKMIRLMLDDRQTSPIDMKSCDFYPIGVNEDPTGIVPRRVFNTWRGFKAEPIRDMLVIKLINQDPDAPSTSAAAQPQPTVESAYPLIEPIVRHFRECWCGGDSNSYEYLMNWFADIVQNPRGRHDSAIILRGPQGCGKSLLANWFGGQVLGDSDSTGIYGETSLARFVEKFNADFENKLLMFVDEAKSSVDVASRGVLSEALKHGISQPRIKIEHKGVDAYEVNCYSRFIFATNDSLPFTLDHDDRRNLVLDCKMLTTPETRKAYWDHMVAVMKNPRVAEQFMTFLSRRDLSEWDSEPHRTNAKDEIKMLSLPSPLQFLHAIVMRDVAELTIPDDTTVDHIKPDTLYGIYSRWCISRGNKAQNFVNFCAGVVPILGKPKQHRKTSDGKRPREYKLVINEMRDAMDKFTRGASATVRRDDTAGNEEDEQDDAPLS